MTARFLIIYTPLTRLLFNKNEILCDGFKIYLEATYVYRYSVIFNSLPKYFYLKPNAFKEKNLRNTCKISSLCRQYQSLLKYVNEHL